MVARLAPLQELRRFATACPINSNLHLVVGEARRAYLWQSMGIHLDPRHSGWAARTRLRSNRHQYRAQRWKNPPSAPKLLIVAKSTLSESGSPLLPCGLKNAARGALFLSFYLHNKLLRGLSNFANFRRLVWEIGHLGSFFLISWNGPLLAFSKFWVREGSRAESLAILKKDNSSHFPILCSKPGKLLNILIKWTSRNLLVLQVASAGNYRAAWVRCDIDWVWVPDH